MKKQILAHKMYKCQRKVSDHYKRIGNDAKGGRVPHVAVSSGLQTDLRNNSDERYSVVTNLDDKLDLSEVFRNQFGEAKIKKILNKCPEMKSLYYE